MGSDTSKKASTPKECNADHIAAKTFTFRELAAATQNFRQDCLLGEGGFGRVYKGRLENGQVGFFMFQSRFIGIFFACFTYQQWSSSLL